MKEPTDPRAVAFADKMMRLTGRGPLTDAEIDEDMRRTVSVRQFVCQGCFQMRSVLYGARIKCSCGTISAAEIMPNGR